MRFRYIAGPRAWRCGPERHYDGYSQFQTLLINRIQAFVIWLHAKPVQGQMGGLKSKILHGVLQIPRRVIGILNWGEGVQSDQTKQTLRLGVQNRLELLCRDKTVRSIAWTGSAKGNQSRHFHVSLVHRTEKIVDFPAVLSLALHAATEEVPIPKAGVLIPEFREKRINTNIDRLNHCLSRYLSITVPLARQVYSL